MWSQSNNNPVFWIEMAAFRWAAWWRGGEACDKRHGTLNKAEKAVSPTLVLKAVRFCLRITSICSVILDFFFYFIAHPESNLHQQYKYLVRRFIQAFIIFIFSWIFAYFLFSSFVKSNAQWISDKVRLRQRTWARKNLVSVVLIFLLQTFFCLVRCQAYHQKLLFLFLFCTLHRL